MASKEYYKIVYEYDVKLFYKEYLKVVYREL